MVNNINELLSQGAESAVYKIIANDFIFKSSNNYSHDDFDNNHYTDFIGKKIILKNRISKNYRHPKLDSKLRISRSNTEARIMKKASLLIPVPRLIKQEGTKIFMEFIKGDLLKDILDDNPKLAKDIGINLAILHQNNIIHGDLTTSNMILNNSVHFNKRIFDKRIYFIDFGLSFRSRRLEDKAVDIHLFKQALESKHHNIFDEAMIFFLEGYTWKESNNVLERLKGVEKRGRNKNK